MQPTLGRGHSIVPRHYTYSHVMPGMSDIAATALEEALSWGPPGRRLE